MAGHDWEALHRALGQATGEWSRDELVVLLRDLIREYVIERGLPTGNATQAAAPDLARLDFPGLITWLKNHLALPELGLFSVDGRRVIVDVDGPREISLARAAEPVPAPRVAERPLAPSTARTTPATAPARPAAAPTASAEGEPAEKPKSLNRGFRGLEFD